MSIYQLTTGLKSITATIVTKAFRGHDTKVISQACTAMGINVNDAFKNAVQNKAYKIAKKLALLDQIDLTQAFKDALQYQDYKIAKSLLSLGQFNINYEGYEGASISTNIFTSNDNPLIERYIKYANADSSFKFTAQMINTNKLLEIATDNPAGYKIISEAIGRWGKDNKLEVQSYDPKLWNASNIISSAPELESPSSYSAYFDNDKLSYPILGNGTSEAI